MSKTPYEIRLNLLEMAKSMCEASWHSNREFTLQEWCWRAEAAKEKGQPIPPIPTINPLNEEDFIQVAERLNAFVSNKE